jgi:hypothetical protein
MMPRARVLKHFPADESFDLGYLRVRREGSRHVIVHSGSSLRRSAYRWIGN